MDSIYLDYASTTPIDPQVLEAMLPYLKDKLGNPGSLHSFGQKTLAAIDFARQQIAKTITANHREIIFTSSATEANNLVLKGVLKNFFRNRKDCKIIPKIIISSIEHPSILETAKDIEKDGSANIVYLPVDKDGVVDLKVLEKELDENTILVSVMWVNNEIGSVQPISKISEIISKFKKSLPLPLTPYPLFHTDASQAFNLFDLNVSKSGVDIMTLSSHKIYGPLGSSCLFIRNTTYGILSPIITGGDQEYGLRAGTENVASIVGFSKAAEISHQNYKNEHKRLADISDYFYKSLKKELPKIESNSPIEEENLWSPHILNLFVPYNDNLIVALDIAKIAASSGSACSQRVEKPSHVLKSIGFNDDRIKHSVRFSFGRFATKEDIDEATKRIIMKFL
ncbi:MAG: cysteine desulfurase family protein [Candidatus Paceibacterota bacterium]|jgi:cysteine desulfurase